MVNREVVTLKGIYTKAIDWGFIDKNPVKGIKLEKENPRLRHLTEEERKSLLKICGYIATPDYLEASVIIALNTGLRKTELSKLKWTENDFQNETLKVLDGKGGKSRIIPFNDTVKKELLKRLKKKKGDYIIFNSKGERMKDLKKSFGIALKRAGIENFKFHDLRTTFATTCAYKGIVAKTLQGWLGHSSIETTMKYYVVSPVGYEKNAIKLLDNNNDTYTDTKEKGGTKKTTESIDLITEPPRNRTGNLLIKSQLLCQLS